MRNRLSLGILLLALTVFTATPAFAMPANPVITVVNQDGGILMQQTLQYTDEYKSPEIKEPAATVDTTTAPTIVITESAASSAVAPAADEQSAMVSRGEIGLARQIVKIAYEQLGKRYVAGGNGPDSFDCSGLTKYIYQKVGINLPRTAATQFQTGIRVDRSNLAPGDLMFFSSSSNPGIGHVAVYVGDNKIIHASTPKSGVIQSSINESYYVRNYKGAVRLAR